VTPLPQRFLAALLLCAALFLVPGTARAKTAQRVPPGNPTLVLHTPAGERTIPAVDLAFVYYERIYYHKGAPRSEEATGERLDVQDRRLECRCVRLDDWSKMKFSKTRQIEIDYPPDGFVARLRVTLIDGRMREVRADSLYGAYDSFPPRFAARVDGEVREFPLILPEKGSWPEERLVRVLLKRPPQPRGRR
jgi:hypothetical protein